LLISESAPQTKLTSSCHTHLSPFLFGYQLEFGLFPYLPGGPTLITPLILAVHCLLASERLPHHFHYHLPLADAALKLLLESPAGSWLTVIAVDNAVADGTKVLGEDELDCELAIGPEEIVAAAMLSLWMSDQVAAVSIARTAFQYARGWIKASCMLIIQLTPDAIWPGTWHNARGDGWHGDRDARRIC
jgi:hypothetical protein